MEREAARRRPLLRPTEQEFDRFEHEGLKIEVLWTRDEWGIYAAIARKVSRF